ncbi:helicase-2 [Sucra jujuba nucleopolyhedrovirus]|uniref:Helicase-2 n=1 Tax=Sucra jujuba nucleopolyhedrovirus TaxID=1563660 RepID=A0A097P8Z0_9ABAC|nr:helicase-2 [Sucra jujuba nucleopolyhedrovirus]AIU41296.1 helicase-2 [Sucra jujuba nucleopolyhedrovirus]
MSSEQNLNKNLCNIQEPILNEEQLKFIKMLKIRRANGQCDPIFVSGNAGTGKTFLLKYLFQEMYLKEQIKVKKIAFTALAARNIDGTTMHKLFRFSFTGEFKSNNINKDLYHIEMLIIDEISMIHATYLDKMDEILRLTKHQPDLPFGGVQVVAFGDLYQLPPVVESCNQFKDQKIDERCYFAGVWKHFILFTLTETMRQNELDFITALNQLRIGDERGIGYFNRLRATQTQLNPMQSTTLVTTVAGACKINDINNKKVCEQSNVVYDIESRSKIRTAKNSELLYVHSADSLGVIPEKITLAIGSRILVTSNCVNSHCINGDIGVIVDFVVNPDNKVDGIVFRSVSDKLLKLNKETLLFKTNNDGSYRNVIERTGFPINLAWAMTIHKMQGATIDRLRIPLGSMFAHGQLYVALSRVRHSSGLELLQDVTKQMLLTNTNIKHVYQEMLTME